MIWGNAAKNDNLKKEKELKKFLSFPKIWDRSFAKNLK
jgi:hypothetical protein